MSEIWAQPNQEQGKRLYLAAQCREIDRTAIEDYGIAGFDLMFRAGQRAFDHLVETLGSPHDVIVLCGPGNNGGDGYIVAAQALSHGIAVQLAAVGDPRSAEAAAARKLFLDAGGVSVALDELDLAECSKTVIVDALLGTGLQSDPRGDIATAIQWINRAGCAVIALDVPSGLNCDTGHAYTPCVDADLTVTFIADKPGLHTATGVDVVGRVILESLSIPGEIVKSVDPVARVVSPPSIPKRPQNSHKGRFGHVVVAGGQPGMLGATVIAGTAALRAGAGLVTILGPGEHLSLAALFQPELMSMDASENGKSRALIASADAVVLGPGMGQGDLAHQLAAICQAASAPLVVDADGLNLLAENPNYMANRILTPHPGEAARLLGTTISDIQTDRFAAAREIVARYGGIVVLKGAGTLVWDGESMYLCDRGNPGMAVAGMGDALSGIIASLAGQGIRLAEAARYGVWIHGMAGDQAAEKNGQAGLLPTDVCALLPALMNSIAGPRT